MEKACAALKEKIPDPTMKQNTQVVGDGKFYACVTLTPL
jgi:hypothetical protein